MAALQTGFTAPGKGLLRALVYAALQECATRIAHRNTGRACGDPVAQRLLARIAADEHRHMVFYRELVAAALALTPGPTLTAIADEVESFEMPGAGLPGFLRRSVLVSEAGLYDARQHRDDVVLPLLVHWEARAATVAGAAADEARRRIGQALVRLDGVARRLDMRRRRRREGRPPGLSARVRGGPAPG